ncbi:cyclase family protein [Williamsia sp. R60]
MTDTDMPHTPARSTWGAFPTTPDRGMANYASSDHVRTAATLVRRGAVFGLDYPLNTFTPSLAALRSAPEHHLISRHRDHRDDYLERFWPQAASHLDGLRHRRHAEHGFYNNTPDEAIAAGTPELGVNHWSENPIVGRGILIDLAGHRAAHGHPIDHAAAEPLDIAELDDTLTAQHIELRTGDLLLIHTGWAHWYLHDATDDQRTAIRASKQCTGIAQSHNAIDWFADRQVALAASDTFALERLPAVPGSPFGADTDHGMMHQDLIALLGLPIGELWKLSDLAADCANDHVYECLLTVKPLNLVGGVGSPANAVAIK